MLANKCVNKKIVTLGLFILGRILYFVIGIHSFFFVRLLMLYRI